MTRTQAVKRAGLYPGRKRITPNHPGAPLPPDSYRP